MSISNKRNKKGFTLAEMLMTVAILLIVGLPNFNGESPNSNGEHLWGVSHRKN